MLRDDGIPKLFFDMFSRIRGSDDQPPMCLNGFTFTLELLSQSAWHGEGLFRKCQCQEKIGMSHGNKALRLMESPSSSGCANAAGS